MIANRSSVLTSEVHEKRTEELSVYDAVLRFRHHQAVVTNESRDLAIEALEQAIKIGPNCALSWAMLSEAICDAYDLRIDSNIEEVNRGKVLARKALALDPNCQNAHWSLAFSLLNRDLGWPARPLRIDQRRKRQFGQTVCSLTVAALLPTTR